MLVVMTGLSASGKTRLAAELMARLPAIRIRSDIERKRQFGLGETANSGSGIGTGIYTPAADGKIYARLLELARTILAANHHVILDASFLKEADRARAIAVAGECEARPVLVEVRAAPAVLRERLRQRKRRAEDASEADTDVLAHQLRYADPLTSTEKKLALLVDGGGWIDAAGVATRIRELALHRAA